MMMKQVLAAAMLSGIALSAVPVHAQVVDLTFEGLKNVENIGNYYNGGLGGDGSGPGPNYGVTFSPNALAVISDQAGGSGNFDKNAPSSGSTIMFFLSGASAYLDYSAGFRNGFSLYYSAINNPGSLSVFSGLDGTGTLLGTLALPVTPASPAGRFQPFQAAGVTFAGTARSIVFAGVENQIGFDDVTFGSAIPGQGAVPEAATWAMMIVGLGVAGAATRRRRQVAARIAYAA